ncbi:MAG: glycerophosphodiester phosphodiesterase family protein, partial [Acidimicrobiia bacterium]
SMQRAGEIGPEFLRGQLVMTPVPLDIGFAFAREFDMDAINPQYAHLRDDTTNLIAEFSRAGLRTVVWDANTAEEIASVAVAGADVIITDDPSMAREVVGQL